MRLNKIGYLIGSGFKGIFTHGLMSFASVTVIMACMIIMGSFALLLLNINGMIEELESENEVVVFVDETLSLEEAQALEAELLAVYNVSFAEFMTREEAMEIFMAEQSDSSYEDIDETVFRHRYVVQLTDIALISDTEQALAAVNGVAKVSAHIEYAQTFITVRNIVSIISVVLVLILLGVSLLIMTNTIRIATFTRREEIAIMKMVGASNAFIRCPFVIEGLVLGLVGGGLSFLLEWGLYELVVEQVFGGYQNSIMELVTFESILWPMLGGYVGISVLVGVIGGSSAIRNYLKV